jgi:hypothetical protein
LTTRQLKWKISSVILFDANFKSCKFQDDLELL